MQLMPHQKEAIKRLRSGKILCGGVGTGKSLTALGYFYDRECGGNIEEKKPMTKPKDLYIITTARKRDTFEWDKECANFAIGKDESLNAGNKKLVIDSWNNIGKYTKVTNAFFIFDEQRVVGNGAWVKSFLKITQSNHWILLSATPGDTWTDYIPVFIANGYYRNRTEFMRRHVIFDTFVNFPKIKSYVNVHELAELKEKTVVYMSFEKAAKKHDYDVLLIYDTDKYKAAAKNRWNPFQDKPIENASEFCSVLRRISNTTSDKIFMLSAIMTFGYTLGEPRHIVDKAIVFYNFNYELDELIQFAEENGVLYSQWNGHKHEPVPKGDKWLYFVQYTAGCEGWNCIETDTIIFYSMSYSYKVMSQAAGRIDRLNTPFEDLYYYRFRTDSPIDKAISKCLLEKKDFNEKIYKEDFK